MSKMANPNETKDISKHKSITSVVELMEMIGRAAEVKYRNGPEAKETLAQKIGRVLDKLLKLIEINRIVNCMNFIVVSHRSQLIRFTITILNNRKL